MYGIRLQSVLETITRDSYTSQRNANYIFFLTTNSILTHIGIPSISKSPHWVRSQALWKRCIVLWRADNYIDGDGDMQWATSTSKIGPFGYHQWMWCHLYHLSKWATTAKISRRLEFVPVILCVPSKRDWIRSALHNRRKGISDAQINSWK